MLPVQTATRLVSCLLKLLFIKVTFGISHRQELDPDPARTATITSGHGNPTKLWGEILGDEKTMMVWTPVRNLPDHSAFYARTSSRCTFRSERDIEKEHIQIQVKNIEAYLLSNW